MKIIIYTSYDCLLKSEENEISIDKNQFASLDYMPKSLYVYPTGKNNIVAFEIELQKESPFYRVIQKENKTLVFLLDGIYVENVEKHSFTHNGKRSDIEVSCNKLTFSSKNKKKILSLPPGAHDFKCGNFFHIIYVLFSLPDKKCLTAYNSSTSQTKIFFGSEIEILSNGFSICSNSLNGAIKQIFYIDNDGLKIKESTCKTKSLATDKLLPLHFIQHIKDYNYQDAFSLLSTSLSSTQDENSLKAFFGEISYIYPLDSNTIFTISNGENKLFTFEVENGKISEIQS